MSIIQKLQTEKSVERSKSCKERSVFHRVTGLAKSALSSVERSVMRRPFFSASRAPSSVKSSVLRRAPRPPSSVPSSVERSVLRRTFRPQSSVLSYEERSVLRQVLRPQLTKLAPKSVKSLESSVRVPLRIKDSGKIQTSFGQRRAALTNRVLRQASRALHPASAYLSVSAIAGRDTPAPGRFEPHKPQAFCPA